MTVATASQIEAVERLVRESIAAVDALAPAALRSIIPALRAARDEARSDLRAWLDRVGPGSERFTGYQRTQVLRSLEATMQRVGELRPAMRKALDKGRHDTGPLAVQNLDTEIQRLSAIFGGGMPTIPQINTAAILAKGDKLLWKRHKNSARRYAGAIGADIKHLLAVGVAKGETIEQLVTRLRRLGAPHARAGRIDAGHDADAIANGLFARHKHWADRLVHTELMNSYNVQHDESIREANANRIDSDEEYLRRWDASADPRTCPICRGLDRTVATLTGSFAGGYKSPPAHPYCRCTVLAWLARWGHMKGEVPVSGEIPKSKRAPPKTEPAARKPRKKDEPKQPRLRPVTQVSSEAREILDEIGRGDYNAAMRKIGSAIERRGMVEASVPNSGVSVSDVGMTMINHSGDTITAIAYRNLCNGSITLSTGTNASMQKLSKVVALHPGAHIGDLGDALRELSKAQSAELSTLIKSVENAQHARDLKTTQDHLGTLIHEVLHGYSPGEIAAYARRGGQIEEITTEVMSRVLGRDLFGVPVLQPHQGAYSYDIIGATRAIAELTGKSEPEAYTLLQRASERYKSRVGKLQNEHYVMGGFSEDVAHVIGSKRLTHIESILDKHLAIAAKQTSGKP